MKRPHLLILSVLFGCGELGLSNTALPAEAVDTGALAPALQIDLLEPSRGPLSGGTPVIVRGVGFDEETVISFGNSPVAVTFIDEETLTLTTPPAAVEAIIDVTVENATERTILRAAYTYTGDGDAPDQPEDPDDPEDPDTGEAVVDGTGLTGGLVELWMQLYACPACFEVPEPTQVSASTILHSPTSGSWLDWIPAVGTCSGEAVGSGLTVIGEDVGASAFLDTTGASITMSRSRLTGTTAYTAQSVPLDNYLLLTSYDLTAGSLFLEDAVQTPDFFTEIQPEGILYDSPLSAYLQLISASNATFAWSPSGTDDDILLVMEVFDPLYATYMGMILCRSTDAGRLTIPLSMFAPYYEQSPVTIQLYRLQMHQRLHPTNGSTIESLSLSGVVGTGTLVR